MRATMWKTNLMHFPTLSLSILLLLATHLLTGEDYKVHVQCHSSTEKSNEMGTVGAYFALTLRRIGGVALCIQFMHYECLMEIGIYHAMEFYCSYIFTRASTLANAPRV